MNEVCVRKEFEEAVAEKIRNMVSRLFCGDGSITCGSFAHEFAWELLTLAKAEIHSQQGAWFKVGDWVMPRRLQPGECGMYLQDAARIEDVVDGYYILGNNQAYKIEYQNHWELARTHVTLSSQECRQVMELQTVQRLEKWFNGLSDEEKMKFAEEYPELVIRKEE